MEIIPQDEIYTQEEKISNSEKLENLENIEKLEIKTNKDKEKEKVEKFKEKEDSSTSNNSNENRITRSDSLKEIYNNPNNSEVHEESLLPSDLLYEINPKKNNLINKKKEKKENNINKKNHNNIKEEKLDTSLNAQKMFFETDIKYLINQLKTHQGSIYLQFLLNNLDDIEINNLLNRIHLNLNEIMCSHYGNYFIQKFFQRLNYNQRIFILNQIQYNFIQIATNKIGTYSIQALIDVLKTPNEEKFLKKLLCQNLMLLFCNPNGQHVIQKIIIDYPENKREFLNNFLLENLDKIATNLYGSLCTNKFIIMNNNLFIRLNFINAVQKFFLYLLNNKYGCSVLVFLLERFGVNYCNFMIILIKTNFLLFISNVNSLNFLEKVMTYLKKYSVRDFKDISWIIIKNDFIVYNLLNSDLGIKVFLLTLKHLSLEQKNFLKMKVNSNFYKEKGLSEKIVQLLL